MHRVGKHYINHIDVLVVGDPVERLIVIDVLVGKIVFCFPCGCFRRRTGDNADQFAVLRLLQRWSKLISAVVS
jgi:hypothetical protein